MLTEIYCSRQCISINSKKVCHAHFNAHKLQKIVSMNTDISETIKDREMGSQILIPQRKFVTRICQWGTQFSCQIKNFTEMYWFHQYLSIDPKRSKFATPTLTPITLKSVYRPHNHILRSRVGGASQSRLHISISLWSL